MSAERETVITRRAGIVASGTLASRILGAVRDAVIAASFGVWATDAFWVAFTIPNALRAILGEGAVSGAFVPVFSEVREKEGPEAARRFLSNLVGTMVVVLLTVAILGALAAPWLVDLYAGGQRDDPEQLSLTIQLTRTLFPYIFLIGLAALGAGALNALKRFAVPAFAPGLLNVAFIAAALGLVPVVVELGLPAIMALAVGALAGGLLQGVALLPSLRKEKLLHRPRLGFRDPYVRKALRLLVPLLAGVGVYQVNVLLSRRFASFLYDGAQSYLYYGQRLVEMPQGMFALAIATAALPTLSDLRNQGRLDEAKRVFRYGLRLALFVAVPATVLLAVLAEPVVTVIFGRGAFSHADVQETARSLVWQSLGVWAVAAVRTTVPMCHSLNDTRTPVVASALNLLTFGGAAYWWMDPMGHAGIAAAMSAAAVVQLAALLLLLRRRTGGLGLLELTGSTLRTMTAAAAAGAAAWAVAGLAAWERGGNDVLNIAVLLGAILAAAVAYLVVSRLLGAPELGELARVIRRKSATPGRTPDTRPPSD